MLRLIMQDEESEAQSARLPEKAVFVDELFSSMSAINIFLEVEEKKWSFDWLRRWRKRKTQQGFKTYEQLIMT